MKFLNSFLLAQLQSSFALAQTVSTLFLFPGQTVDPNVYSIVDCNFNTSFSIPTTTSGSLPASTNQYVTITNPYPDSVTLSGLSSTTLAIPTGTIQGTVEVFVPRRFFATTLPYAGTIPITVTIATPSGTSPGTIAVLTPAAYATTTILNTGTDIIPITTTIAQPSGSIPGLIEVLTPGRYTTVFVTGDSTLAAPYTTVLAAPVGTAPGTVEVVVPGSYQTVTVFSNGISAPITTTVVLPSGNSPGTIEVIEPSISATGFVTVTLPYTGTSALTAPITSTILPSGTQLGTIEILTPGGFVTLTQTDPNLTGTNIVTSILAAPSGTNLGTIEVFVPPLGPTGYTTIYGPYTGTSAITGPITTTLALPSGTNVGTVEVLTPSSTFFYVTITAVNTGTDLVPITTTLAQPSGSAPGTVEVLIPGSFVTTTLFSAGLSSPTTTTLVQPSGTQPGTVEIIEPGSFVTFTLANTLPGGGLVTTTIALPSGTNPGTVDVLTPNSYTTTTIYSNGLIRPTSTTLATPANGSPGTVEIIVPASTTTVTSVNFGTDTVPITTTLAAQSGTIPGTVEILRPVTYQTFTIPYTGDSTITAPITTTVLPSGGSNIALVEILTPGTYVTITSMYTPSGTASGTTTLTAAQPSGTVAGTKYILIPVSFATVTSAYTGTSSLTGTITTTLVPASGTVPGTIELIIPASYVTVTSFYTGSSSTSLPYTTTTVSPSGTNPGTVIVYITPYVTVDISTGTQTTTSYSTVATPSGTVQGTIDVFLPASSVKPAATCAANGPLCRAVTGTTASCTCATRWNGATACVESTTSGTCTNDLQCPAGYICIRGSGFSSNTCRRASSCTNNANDYITTTITATTVTATTTTTVAQPSGTNLGVIDVLVPVNVYCTAPNSGSNSTSSSSSTSNRGLQYGVWTSTTTNENTHDTFNGFPNYPVTGFDNTPSLYIGITPSVGFTRSSSGGSSVLYSDTSEAFPNQGITVIHRGFLYARQSGTYTFGSSNANDITLIWVGNNALSGFTRDNANLVQTYNDFQFGASSTSFTQTLTAGQYLPIRIQYANANGGGTLSVTVTGPNGNTLLSSTGSTDIVTGACDGSTPTFPAFSQNGAVTSNCGVSGSFCTSILSAQITGTGVCVDLSNCQAEAAQLAYAEGASSYAIAGNTFYFFNTDFTTIQNIINSFGVLSFVCGFTNIITNTLFYDSTCVSSSGTVYCNSAAAGVGGIATVGTGAVVTVGTANKGLLYTLYESDYDNSAPYGDGTDGYQSYAEDSFLLPLFTGQTNTIGVAEDPGTSLIALYPDEFPIYNSSYKTIIHTGYVFARTSGTYTFTSTFSDDITLLWLGTTAQSGYTRANAALVHTFTTGTQPVLNHSVSLTQGNYLPVRIQWGNAGPPGGFNFTISGPAGTLMDYNDSYDVVTVPCSGNLMDFVTTNIFK